MRSDGGFEDREDHQAPFTLRKIAECRMQIADCGKLTMKTPRLSAPILLELFDLADNGLEIGPVTGIEFGMEQFAIGANFKGAAARRDEGERFDAFAEFKNFGRQTDGLRRVVSNDAIFDRDFHLHPVCSFPVKRVRKSGGTVKVAAIGRRTEDGGRRTEDGGQRTEDGGQKTEDRRQRTEDRGQRTEDRGQKTEMQEGLDESPRTCPALFLSSVFCPL